jgi:phosphomannomutase
VKLPLFGISGLRGVVGHDLFPETVARLAAAFGAATGAGRVALGRDSRVSGEMFASAARAGLQSAGCAVVDLGICPTPTVLHCTRTTGLDAGIVITASHNPDRWNGMKFCRADGRFITADEVAGLRERFAQSGERAEWLGLRPGARDDSAVANHVRAVVESPLFAFKHRKLRIGVDAVNGAASQAAQVLVRAFGAEPVPLYCDPSPESLATGFPRRPEPVAEHLGALESLVREAGLDAGFAFDPDGDRFSCVDETGCALGEEATICLACRYVLARTPGPVVVNLSTTRPRLRRPGWSTG